MCRVLFFSNDKQALAHSWLVSVNVHTHAHARTHIATAPVNTSRDGRHGNKKKTRHQPLSSHCAAVSGASRPLSGKMGVKTCRMRSDQIAIGWPKKRKKKKNISVYFLNNQSSTSHRSGCRDAAANAFLRKVLSANAEPNAGEEASRADGLRGMRDVFPATRLNLSVTSRRTNTPLKSQ